MPGRARPRNCFGLRLAGLVLCIGLSLIFASPMSAQPVGTGLCTSNPTAPPIDNRDGYFVNREEGPIHPMELNHDGSELWVADLVDGSVSIFDVRTNPLKPRRIAEVNACLGPVTIRRRPARPAHQQPVEPEPGPIGVEPQPVDLIQEMWVVCQSSDTVAVFDAKTRRLKESIRLRGEPADLLFARGGDAAFVSLMAINQVVMVDANNLASIPTQMSFAAQFPIASAVQNQFLVHAEEPGSMLRSGDDLFVLSHMSGNGTFPDLNTSFIIDPPIVNQWELVGGVIDSAEPPDRDVFRFSVSNPTATADAVLWRMGTINFDLVRGGPTDSIYVSTLDLINQTLTIAGATTHEGEFDYLDGINDPTKPDFAVHGVAYAQPSSSNTPQSTTTFVDLNDGANHHGSLAASFRCALPTEMAFAGSNLLVTCYETRNVAVLDTTTDTVIAELAPPAGLPTLGIGPRGVVVNSAATVAWVYLRADGRLQSYDLTLASGGASVPPAKSTPIAGYDITPHDVIAGRSLHIDSLRSGNGLVSCNTCHIDGHLDGLLWDLSDFTGNTDADSPPVGRVPKGSKVTMSLRGIEETPPFHWRGDRADLEAFNPAFSGLLGGNQLTLLEMDQFKRFVFSLSYPPNPNQLEDRSYTPQAIDGWDCFSMSDAHDVSSDTNGGLLAASCEDCHSMAGASGTLNQVNNPLIGLLADDATQTRGLWDKDSDVVDYVAAYGTNPLPLPYSLPQLGKIPVLGFGFGNTGFTDSVLDFVNLGVFNLIPSGSQPDITKFLDEFDTGLAPTTSYAFTLNAATSPGTAPINTLTTAAGLGHNDLIVRGWVKNGGGVRVPVGMLWRTSTSDFEADDSTLGPSSNGIFTLTDLQNLATANDGVFMLMGTPVGSGVRLGIDRDMDDLKNSDEAGSGTTAINPDFDNDGRPDGYEVFWTTDPTDPNSFPGETTGPVITPNPGVSWTNSNVAKIRWLTDELATSRVEVWELIGGGPTLIMVSAFDEAQFKKYHSMVVRGLEPGHVYQFRIVSTDPSGNPSQVILANETMRTHLFASTHLTSTTLAKTSQNGNGTMNYDVTFTVVDEDQQPVSGAQVVFTLVEWEPGTAVTSTVTSMSPAGTTNGSGQVTYSVVGVKDFSAVTGKAETFATSVSSPNNDLYFRSLNGQFNFWDDETVP